MFTRTERAIENLLDPEIALSDSLATDNLSSNLASSLQLVELPLH